MLFHLDFTTKSWLKGFLFKKINKNEYIFKWKISEFSKNADKVQCLPQKRMSPPT